ncbi:CvpA family protein [Stenoxybacter acetivorans]|uniref:CvpA family protein n=1 Tax=Stenoxybacter acetivorans TaxID=422441 RepID=UPI00055FBBD7|nr:CvpA family protein [Stenoxybacter acetivorans]
MTLFDVLALGLIALSMLVSVMRGLVAEAASLCTWIATFLFAKNFSAKFADVAFVSIQPRQLAVALSFVLLLLAGWVVLKLVASLFQSGVSAFGLSSINRLLGAVFGAARGVLIVAVAVLVCAFTDLPKTPSWQNARTAWFFEQVVKQSLPFLPPLIADQVHYPND